MELKPGVGSNTVSSCSGPLNKSPAISGFLHPRLSREAWKHSQTSAPAEAELSQGQLCPLGPPWSAGGGRPGEPRWCWDPALQSAKTWALRSGRVTAPGDRHRSSTAVSSEVKGRARRARRVHTNTHPRAQPTRHTLPLALGSAIARHQPPRPLTRTHPSAPATDHEAPRLPDAWTSARDEGWPSPARGGLPRGDTQPRRAIPAASRESPPGVRPELNLSAAASPPSRVSRLRSRLAMLSPPTGPMTAAAAQRQADYNKKQSFPLGPPTPAPSASPLPFNVMQNEPALALRLQVPDQPSGAAPGSAGRPLSSARRAPASGGSFSAPPHPHSPGFPQPGAQRKSPNYGAKLYAFNRQGAGCTTEGVGGAHAVFRHFRGLLEPAAPVPCPPPRSPSHQFPRRPLALPPGTPEHPLLSRACRRWGSQALPEPGLPPGLPFPQHRRARTGAARRRGTQAPPDSLSAPVLPASHPHPGRSAE